MFGQLGLFWFPWAGPPFGAGLVVDGGVVVLGELAAEATP
jgi:hypothetical protein